MLSVIIPAYKDPYLQKTIDSLLQGVEGEIEIIPVLDGYWPSPPLKEDSRVKVLHLEKNLGMRGAINAGVKASKGEYIMKSDAHCMFGKGFDRLLLERIKDNWVVVPRLYYLDTDKWEVMEGRGNDYSRLIINPERGLTSLEWISRTRQREDKMIDDTMAFQGSCWLMSRKWWDKAIKRLEDENYGSLYHEQTEIVMKTFVAGGRTMVNKKTWYAHKHRKFGRTHRISDKQSKKRASDYALKAWQNEFPKIFKYFGLEL